MRRVREFSCKILLGNNFTIYICFLYTRTTQTRIYCSCVQCRQWAYRKCIAYFIISYQLNIM